MVIAFRCHRHRPLGAQNNDNQQTLVVAIVGNVALSNDLVNARSHQWNLKKVTDGGGICQCVWFMVISYSYSLLTQLTISILNRTFLGFWMDQLHFTDSTFALAPCFLLIRETDGADETLKKVGRLTL